MTDVAAFIWGFVVLAASTVLLFGLTVRVVLKRRTRRQAAADAPAKRSPTQIDIANLGATLGEQVERLTHMIEERDRTIQQLHLKIDHWEQQKDTDSRVEAIRHAGEQLLTSYDAAKRLVDSTVTSLPSLEAALRRFQEDMEVAVRENRKMILADRALDSLLGTSGSARAIPMTAPVEEPKPETPQAVPTAASTSTA